MIQGIVRRVLNYGGDVLPQKIHLWFRQFKNGSTIATKYVKLEKCVDTFGIYLCVDIKTNQGSPYSRLRSDIMHLSLLHVFIFSNILGRKKAHRNTWRLC